MAEWERWVRYGKAKLDDLLKSGNAELDRREAELEAEQAAKPWLGGTDPNPTLDQVKARIEHEARQAGTGAPTFAGAAPPIPTTAVTRAAPAEAISIDFAAQQRQADERLAAIRAELGLDRAAPAAPEGGDPPEGADGPRR